MHISFRWVLLKIFSQGQHNTRYNHILQQLLRWKRLWQIYQILLAFMDKNNSLAWIILEYNYLYAKTSLCACCMHAHHHACNLLNPANWQAWWCENFWRKKIVSWLMNNCLRKSKKLKVSRVTAHHSLFFCFFSEAAPTIILESTCSKISQNFVENNRRGFLI